MYAIAMVYYNSYSDGGVSEPVRLYCVKLRYYNSYSDGGVSELIRLC